MATTKTTKPSIPALPAGILKSDTKRPPSSVKYADCFYGQKDFQMWFTESFGWCIPTLKIGTSRRANQDYSGGERTYAVRVSDGGTVRIGNGPHIKARVTVYAHKGNIKRLEPFYAKQESGAERANTIRDRISTRRAQGVMRRGFFF